MSNLSDKGTSVKAITDFSDDELQAEIKRRQEQKPPEVKANINWYFVIKTVQESLQKLAETGQESKDFEHWVFEAVIEAMYGASIWKWYNGKLR
jgi:hypothetical protein